MLQSGKASHLFLLFVVLLLIESLLVNLHAFLGALVLNQVLYLFKNDPIVCNLELINVRRYFRPWRDSVIDPISIEVNVELT